ncbi:hypothetical protein B0A48_15616 [Cryoendolithus antarcticus]|uniref:Zn(2)-C6 fungal-type domain-containing protein n=1 Tax=Cryoendolithus antarcticus TaxID=1507870 RepID=A0A1V8SGY1_9PEZI|nr:hypothetical protein B0A48_15616 [Cryoendolithus antarcticus]
MQEDHRRGGAGLHYPQGSAHMEAEDAEDVSPSPDPETGFEVDIDSSTGIMAEEKVERASRDEKSAGGGSNGEGSKSKSAKDPSRPRRKKARRACFACQRAHLTCGDERPCLRCVKRGLQDQCHDGVRKKAKYLHDAPPEALVAGFPSSHQMGNAQGLPTGPGAHPMVSNAPAISSTQYMPQSTATDYVQYQQTPMGPPMMTNNDAVLGSYAPPQPVETPQRYPSTSSQQVTPVQDMLVNVDHQASIDAGRNQSFDTAFLDPNNSSLFGLDLSSFNFGNHYGAMEFGMLGHMSSGAVGTPDTDNLNNAGNRPGSLSYDSFGSSNNFDFNQYPNNWQTVQSTGSRMSDAGIAWATQNNGTDAFAIGEGSHLGLSPLSQNYDYNAGYQSSSTVSPENRFAQLDHGQQQQPDLLRQSVSHASHQQQQRKQVPQYSEPANQRRVRRDTSEIYNSVTAPYTYTQGFHALTDFLKKRFSTNKTLRIAKALASIRPSFIACNKSLNNDDLIFMEKSLQRTLYEYDDFMNHYGTPTIICRRTGEIAAVNKEFSLVTGWRRDVLLGKEPNLNVNIGANSNNSGTHTGASTRGAATPRLGNVEIDPGRPQPVFLAELMDEDSVVQFYEDFADLAFGASGSEIIGRECALLKYKTKRDPGWGVDEGGEDEKRGKRGSVGDGVKREGILRGRDGMNSLGEGDGRVDCGMCWTVKRDVFNIPMLIVINFLPVI